MEDLNIVFENFEQLLSFLLISLWWIYTPVLLFWFLILIFQIYTKTKHFLSLKWVLLEIRVPKEVRKSPKAMENIFATLHGILDPPRFKDRFFKGKVQNWYSFELVGKGGDIKFYVRTLESFRNLVESQFYAQYPDCEIVEVSEDHVSTLPPKFTAEEFDIFGTEFILTKEDPYPIKTYLQFEELNPGREPEAIKRIDPLASITETLSRLNAGEYMGMQILAQPTGDQWVKDSQAVIDKILGKEPKTKDNFLVKTIKFIDSLLPGPAPKEEKKEEKRKDQTPGQYEVLKAVETNMSKLGYKSGLRFLYLAPKETFQKSHVASINGSVKQFSTYNLNGFKMNMSVATFAKGLFKNMKIKRKKNMILKNYKLRQLVRKPGVLTTEELATIYHFPDVSVKAPLLPRIEAKKGEPPSELPVV